MNDEMMMNRNYLRMLIYLCSFVTWSCSWHLLVSDNDSSRVIFREYNLETFFIEHFFYWAFFSEMTFTTRKLKMIKACRSKCSDSSFMIFLLLSSSVLNFLNVFDWVFSMMISWLSMMRLKVIMWFTNFVSWSDESIVIISTEMIIFISNFSFLKLCRS